MSLRRVIAVLVVLSLVPQMAIGHRAHAAPTSEVVALVVEGVGYGHGRGMSQWGAYGRATNGRQTWQQILDAYYGGTRLSATTTTQRTRVRLVALDGATMIGVISTRGRALWQGVGYRSLQARQVSAGRYDIYAASSLACPAAATTGWTRIAVNVAAPIRFTTDVSEASGAAGDVLGLCSGGAVVHYRGFLEVTRDSTGAVRVVNDVGLERYLRGVVSREVSTSWGNAASGRGMNALRAQAVAARSFAAASNRYQSSGGYARTCDTSVCQAYGGAARRATPTGPLVTGGTCEAGNVTFECANTDRAIRETAGWVRRWPDNRIAATEFSASNGPVTAGGTFRVVSDPWDDIPQNPNHRWTRIIDADHLETAYGLGAMTSAVSEPDPTTPFYGVWDNRVRLTGSLGGMLVGNLALRSTFGLPSHGFTVRAITRTASVTTGMRFIGDSVGATVTDSSTTELPALFDGVFGSVAYDAVPGRCTSGCAVSGASAAASVPVGTRMVIVQLGYDGSTSQFGAQIDAVMTVLRSKQVRRVLWVSLAERSGRSDFIAANQALLAALRRWSELRVIDWRAVSAGTADNRNRWFTSDGFHLTPTGQARYSLLVRDVAVSLAPR